VCMIGAREKGIGIRLGRLDPIDQTICVVGAEERGRGLLFFSHFAKS
jgi:hypothetical protein